MLTDLFYTVNFSISLIASSIGLPAAILTTTIIYVHRPYHNIPNLLKCNTLASMIVFMILVFISAIFGLREDWARYQTACSFRAYCYTTVCMIICSSYSIQAISRLFYTVLYRYRFLQTWRVHWILIISSWLISFLAQAGPFVVDKNFYNLELESRFCVGTTQKPFISLFCILFAFVVPLGTILIIYAIIIYHVRQSGLRVHAFAARSTDPTAMNNIPSLSVKREMRLARNMMILLCLATCSGILFLLLLVWNLGRWSRPPEALYLLSINAMVLGVSFMMVFMFVMNKEVRNFLIDRLKTLR